MIVRAGDETSVRNHHVAADCDALTNKDHRLVADARTVANLQDGVISELAGRKRRDARDDTLRADSKPEMAEDERNPFIAEHETTAHTVATGLEKRLLVQDPNQIVPNRQPDVPLVVKDLEERPHGRHLKAFDGFSGAVDPIVKRRFAASARERKPLEGRYAVSRLDGGGRCGLN